ncbi:MAG: restriction endonuclease subunit S [Deltaproteobacteria bacterium]|nr:restriction endonuclease subunit S [Deltaproteobacteria bacterium]
MTKPLPKGWRRVRLGEFLSPSKLRFVVRDDVTYTQVTVRIRHKGIVARGYEQGSNIKTKNQNQIKAGQFLISKIDARNGACGIVPPELDDAVTTHDFLAYDVNPEIVDPGFWDIYSSLPSFVELCALASEGTTNRVRLRPDEFLDMEIVLPPLPEQKRIAATLQSVDAAIRANEEVIEKTRDLKKSLANELLTRGIPGRHKRFKDSPIGKIPVDWEVKRLGGLLLRIEAGKSPKCEDRPASPEEWGVLKVSAVSWGTFHAHENKALLPSTLPFPDSEVQEGDLLLSRANTPDLVGRCVIVGKVRRRLLLSDKTLRLVPNDRLTSKQFLNIALNSPDARIQISLNATGSSRSMKNISQETLRDVVLPIPPIDEQRQITEALDTTDPRDIEAKTAVQEYRKVGALLRSSLLAGISV